MPAGSIIIDLLMKTGSFETDSKRAEKRLREMERTAKQVGAAIGTAFVVAGTVVAGLTKHAIDMADEMRDLSIRVGESTETLSAYSYQASQTGTDVEALGKGLKVLSKNMADSLNPTSEQAKVFEALGIKVTDADGKLRKLSDVLPEIADRYKILDDGTTKAALSQALFGKAGLEMTEFLNQGSEGMAAFAKKAQELGIIIDGDTATAADNFNDTIGDLKAQASGFGLAVARELLPQLQQAASDFSALAREGNLAHDVASVLGATFSAGASLLGAYEKTVRLVTLAMENYMTVASSVLEIQKNLLSFGFADGTVSGALDRIRQQKAASDKEMADIMAGPKAAPVRLIFAGQDADPAGLFKQSPQEVALRAQLAELEKRLALALSNPTATKPKPAGESEAEKLQKQFDAANARLKEQLALFGSTTEAAQVYYEVTEGALKNLAPEQKKQLLDMATELDLTRQRQDAIEKEEAAREQLRQETEAGIANTERLIDDMKFELAVMGMSNDERAKAIALRYADKHATAAQIDEIEKFAVALERAHEKTNFMDDFRSNAADALKSIVTDFSNAGKHIGEFFDNLADRIAEMIANRWIEQLFGAQGTTGQGTSGGNLIGSLFGMFFGGARASGGDVIGGRSYLVGEDGPELFTPRTAGMVLDAGSTAALGGGGAGMTQNNAFYYQAPPDRRTQQQTAARVGFEAQRALARNGR